MNGVTKDYREARAQAQSEANEAATSTPAYAKRGGCDYLLERNPLFGTWSWRRLPLPENRYGHELRAEVVMPEINRF